MARAVMNTNVERSWMYTGTCDWCVYADVYEGKACITHINGQGGDEHKLRAAMDVDRNMRLMCGCVCVCVRARARCRSMH